MSRIVPSRIGYVGYTCVGISLYVIPGIDCSPYGYKRIPPSVEQGVTNYPFEEMATVIDSPERTALAQLCNINYDPFTGSFMNLYSICNTYTPAFIENDCYETGDIYETGILPEISRMKLKAGSTAGCG